jgi:hypothetical protein
VIDVHRRKTTLVVVRVPECKLLAAMRGAERVGYRGPPACPASRSCQADQAEPQPFIKRSCRSRSRSMAEDDVKCKVDGVYQRQDKA